MNFFYSFFILFFISSNLACGIHKETDPYAEVMSVINMYSKIVKKEKNIELRGYGLHHAGPDKIYDGKIHEINLSYSIDKKMKFTEARGLFYSLVDGLLECLNKKESIRNYFRHYPVDYSDLHFRLSFNYDDEVYLSVGDISMIGILENKIKYFIVEEDGGTAQVETKQIIPDVYIGTGLSPKTRCVTKKLPETDLEE
ncbi:MAG: hypothetical protein V4487_01810 [Chlamydiota bacterium]